VRIIASSSVPLKKLVEDNLFREDLFFRLHVYPVYVPDLNERRGDIPLLADHFLHLHAKRQKKNIQNLHEEVIDFIKQRTWEGNIRELENFIERMMAISSKDTTTIDPSHFPMELQEELEEYRLRRKSHTRSVPIKQQMEKYEAEIIKNALIECGWNQSKAARKLQTSESNIRYKMNLFNIQRDETS
jgi:DNA-binding NtrC family response regulator